MGAMTNALTGITEVLDARERIAGQVMRTALLSSPSLSGIAGSEVRLKCENLQRGGSFKLRGVMNFLARMVEGSDPIEGVITYSSGNHGRALALAAALRGLRCVVVMPTTAPEIKQSGAAALGAEVVLEGTTSIERRLRAEAIGEEQGLRMVPPFDDPWIIAGQGTVGSEIAEEWPEVETVLVPIGGGGLASGVGGALRSLLPHVRIVGIEPEDAASMKAALERDAPVTLTRTSTIADGLAAVRAGELTFLHVRAYLDEVVSVPDRWIREAARHLLVHHAMAIEFSGAASVAALLSGAVRHAGRTAVILSGGNVDPRSVENLLQR